jgi:hypothetical protein
MENTMENALESRLGLDHIPPAMESPVADLPPTCPLDLQPDLTPTSQWARMPPVGAPAGPKKGMIACNMAGGAAALAA